MLTHIGMPEMIDDDSTVNDAYAILDRNFGRIRCNTVYTLYMDYDIDLGMAQVSKPQSS